MPVGEPLRLTEAERYGLRPLILYGLTVAGLPIRWMTFAPLDQPGAVREVYESLSHGGDACPFEIVPRRGAADPSWRYVLISMYDAPPSILMAPRGEKITERLPELLLNFDGIHPVDPEFYRDVVTTCAQACSDPAANKWEMKDFAKRYEKRWKKCTWQPE